MKKSTLILSILFLSFLSLNSINSYAGGGHSGKSTEKTWTRWELSPNADIYYRVAINNTATTEITNTVEVEFLNNYKKEVSFCFALNDTGNSAEVIYQPIIKLRKNKSVISFYPRPKTSDTMTISITSLQVGN